MQTLNRSCFDFFQYVLPTETENWLGGGALFLCVIPLYETNVKNMIKNIVA